MFKFSDFSYCPSTYNRTMARKTRSHKSAKSYALYDLLGSGSEIIHSELPILRQCLRYGLFLRERSENI